MSNEDPDQMADSITSPWHDHVDQLADALRGGIDSVDMSTGMARRLLGDVDGMPELSADDSARVLIPAAVIKRAIDRFDQLAESPMRPLDAMDCNASQDTGDEPSRRYALNAEPLGA